MTRRNIFQYQSCAFSFHQNRSGINLIIWVTKKGVAAKQHFRHQLPQERTTIANFAARLSFRFKAPGLLISCKPSPYPNTLVAFEKRLCESLKGAVARKTHLAEK
jgi:hypothetical protein